MIRGEFVNLRAVEREDAGHMHRWCNDPDVMRWWGVPASTVSRVSIQEDVEGWLEDERRLDRPAALIIELLDGEPVGLIVLTDYRAEHRSCELSILIGDPSRWGHGLGTDAVRSVLDACLHAWNLHRVWVRSEAGNTRAHRLYRRCGFQQEATVRDGAYLNGRYQDVLLFSILEDEPYEPGSEKSK